MSTPTNAQAATIAARLADHKRSPVTNAQAATSGAKGMSDHDDDPTLRELLGAMAHPALSSEFDRRNQVRVGLAISRVANRLGLMTVDEVKAYGARVAARGSGLFNDDEIAGIDDGTDAQWALAELRDRSCALNGSANG